jgi:hypothetical protein
MVMVMVVMVMLMGGNLLPWFVLILIRLQWQAHTYSERPCVELRVLYSASTSSGHL